MRSVHFTVFSSFSAFIHSSLLTEVLLHSRRRMLECIVFYREKYWWLIESIVITCVSGQSSSPWIRLSIDKTRRNESPWTNNNFRFPLRSCISEDQCHIEERSEIWNANKMDVCCALETATKILLWTAKHNTGGFRLSSRMTMCYDKQKSRCCARIEWQCLRLVIDDKNRLLEQNSDEGQPIISHLVSGGLAMNDDGSLIFLIMRNVNFVCTNIDMSLPILIFLLSYVSDSDNDRVISGRELRQQDWLVAGSRNEGNGSGQLFGPGGLLVDRMDSVYVVKQGKDRVMRWLRSDATDGRSRVDQLDDRENLNVVEKCSKSFGWTDRHSIFSTRWNLLWL